MASVIQTTTAAAPLFRFRRRGDALTIVINVIPPTSTCRLTLFPFAPSFALASSVKHYQLSAMAEQNEMACVYAALVLHDDGIPITVSFSRRFPILLLLSHTHTPNPMNRST